MFRQQRSTAPPQSAICADCGGKQFLLKGNSLTCTNCGWKITGVTANKYGAKRTLAKDGKVRDSKYEAGVADSLLARKQVRDIRDYESQFVIEASAYRSNGLKAFTVRHKVDFRIHHNDGSFELLEAKGVETEDYKWRRKFLENIWLPDHPDHTYTVIKQGR